MCEFILISMIVGAYEFAPGTMRVEVIHPEQPELIQTLNFDTDDYLGCFEAD